VGSIRGRREDRHEVGRSGRTVDPRLDRVRRIAEELSAAADAFSSSAVDQYLIQADTRPDAPDIQCVVSFYFESTFLCSTVMDNGRVT
jgi:hypothetical protein